MPPAAVPALPPPARCIDVPLLGQQCIDNPILAACNGLAEAYYRGVDAVAQESFDRDQGDQAQHVEQCEAAAAGP